MERQCFLKSLCHWGRSGGKSCTWICFNIYLFIIYFICCMVWYTMRWTRVPSKVTRSTTLTRVPPNVTRSTTLRETQHSPELVFRSADFRGTRKPNFPALNKINVPEIKEHLNLLFCFLTKIKSLLPGPSFSIFFTNK